MGMSQNSVPLFLRWLILLKFYGYPPVIKLGNETMKATNQFDYFFPGKILSKLRLMTESHPLYKPHFFKEITMNHH
jgi:hypothetical protein